MEARWLVEELSDGPWPAVLSEPVTARAGIRFEELLERRANGEPFQYVLGHWPFRKLDLMVDRRVLIPRPETEVVVEVALAELDGLGRAPAVAPAVAVDLGTGSGAIALSLVAERSGVEVWATDASSGALSVARANLAGLGAPAARVRLAEGSWWDALPRTLAGRIDLAVSNPPYVSSGEMVALDPGVTEWEPRTALEAGPFGTEEVGTILREARAWLAPRASIVVEIAPHQAGEVRELALDAGFLEMEVRPDLAGRDRVFVARTAPL
ncbi:MAG: peptide chain release factor N(5)-glutamine methyltransferase [Acidimicrobiaceae bacterium]|nr:peptide chain release factor N(5)-glutamine methyltransferase [Acidimicrobiaceae bacterium]